MKRLISLTTLIFSCNLFAYDEERALNNLASDYADCTAYFKIISVGGSNSGFKKIEDDYNKLANLTFEATVMLSNEETAKSRVLLYMEDQQKEMDYHYSNVSRLRMKYEKLCINLVEDPKARLKYWLDK